MVSPAISMIIPVYGVERYIEDCLRSIAAQTFSDFEVILVDDGSTDRSIEVAEEYLRTTNLHWKTLRQQNQGQGPARDNGIRNACGDYVVCVDSDDTVAPTFLESLYTAAAQQSADVAFCLFRMVKDKTPFSDEKTPYQIISRQEMLHRFLCRTLVPILPAMLIRRAFIDTHRLATCEGCRFSEDIYYMWLVFSTAERIVYTTTPLYHYLLRQNSTMTASSKERILSGYQALCSITQDKRFCQDFQEAALVLPRWVLGALNSSARICPTYKDFIDIARQMDYRTQMAVMRTFPERKARWLALFLRITPMAYYHLLHRTRKGNS